MTKSEMRIEAAKILKNLTPVQKGLESSFKCASFIQSDDFKNADVIFAFMPTKLEPDILPILREALNQQKKVLVPKTYKNSNDMDFFYVQNDFYDETQEGAFGIFEPKENLLKCNIEELAEKHDGSKIAVLVPGLAFGFNNSRLGHGKGFYDKFLFRMKNIFKTKPNFIGVCFDALKTESVPTQETDVFMDKII